MRIILQRLSFPLLIFCTVVLPTGWLLAQTTPEPTLVPGINRIEQSADGNTFVFLFNGIPMYRYEAMPGGSPKGDFVGLSASTDGSDYFIPAMCGGVICTQGTELVYPCQEDVSYRLADRFVAPDSISLHWAMNRNGAPLYNYSMSMHIRGKTLIIDIRGADNNRNGAGITLAEATSPGNDLVTVPVPYLTLTNLLYKKSSRSFTSMFFDWERTNCSRMLPLSTESGHTLFTSSADYFPKTNGARNRINERIYLTVSQNLDEVMPNVVGPVAPLKSMLESKIVVSYHLPFYWLLNPVVPSTSLPSYLDTLNNLGIRDVALLVKDWWWSGFDRGNPRILPANDYLMQRDGWDCADFERSGGGGNSVLKRVRDKARLYGYLFGLHQNYVDMYTNARPGGLPAIPVDSDLVSRLPGVEHQQSWAYPGNCRHENAWAIKPSRAFDVASRVSSALYATFQTDWNYLDVTSAVNPSGPLPIEGRGEVNGYVDFDAGRTNSGGDSAGMFLYTLHKYRGVAQAVRNSTHNGPVQGEGGNHFLYAGYFDDFEARIRTARPEVSGYSAPLFLDFHLRKLRGTSSFHGAGHIYEFYDRGWGAYFSDREVLTFIATELAYGHGALVTKSAHNCADGSPCDHSLKQIVLENRHVLPMQKLLANAKAKSILYYDRNGIPKTASEYIADHPDDFADNRSPNFMGKVRVEYSNGVVVYVNRCRAISGDWTVTGLPVGGRYNYNLKLANNMVQEVGSKPAEPLILPPECGWLCYSPQ